MDIEIGKNKKQEGISGLKENSKNRDIITKLQGNPARLQGLKESFKYFTLLKRNVYLERKQYKATPDEILLCNCAMCPEEQVACRPQGPQYSYNCGDRCLNKYTCTECDVDLCPSGELCKNRRFQKHEDACVFPQRCGGKGMGLYAGERILKGQFIMQYIGEIFYINSAMGRRRVQEYSKSTCTYLMKINNQEVIDPTYKGNLARFINHSCNPNCITVKWNVLGEVCIGIFANRDINDDDELTFDYQFDAYHTPLTKCLCGAPNCKGYLGLKPTNISQEEWEEHLENLICKICQSKTPQDDEQLLLCDKCNCGFHMMCLVPPLTSVPKDSWFCQECLDESRLQDEQDKDRQKIEGLLQKKIKQLTKDKKRAKKESRSSSSSSSNSEEYDKRYKQLKNIENETTLELLNANANQQTRPIIPMQSESAENPIPTAHAGVELLKKHQQQYPVQLLSVGQGKTLQLQTIVEIAHSKFIKAYDENVDLQQRINQLQQQLMKGLVNQDTIKECIRVNIIEQKVVKKNAQLIYLIGHKTSFEQVDQQYVDIFRKENDLTIIGSKQQLEIFQEVLGMIDNIIKELKKEMGIIEGMIKVPIIYLKRLIKQFNDLEQEHEVNIIYNKNLAQSEEIFPLDRVTPLKIKGSKQHIEKTVNEVDRILRTLQVQRLYISRSETKTVQQNMYLLKQNAEIRISRDSVYNQRGEQTQRDINHPFFYIQYREKEVCLIGTASQVNETGTAIRNLLIQEQNNDKEMTYFTVLISPQYKENCKAVKQTIEKNSQSTKVLLFEASHPRKNMTILVLCLRSAIKQTKLMFNEMILNQCNLKLDQFQDQMSMQMCRYVFKYLQNTMMTQEMAFMKNWDLITPYFYQFNLGKYREQKFENWFVKRCYPALLRDYETQLYIQYTLGKEIQENLNEQERSLRRKHLIQLTKRILGGILGQRRFNEFQQITEDIQPQVTSTSRFGNPQLVDSYQRFTAQIIDIRPQQSRFQDIEIQKAIPNRSSSSSSSSSSSRSVQYNNVYNNTHAYTHTHTHNSYYDNNGSINKNNKTNRKHGDSSQESSRSRDDSHQKQSQQKQRYNKYTNKYNDNNKYNDTNKYNDQSQDRYNNNNRQSSYVSRNTYDKQQQVIKNTSNYKIEHKYKYRNDRPYDNKNEYTSSHNKYNQIRNVSRKKSRSTSSSASSYKQEYRRRKHDSIESESKYKNYRHHDRYRHHSHYQSTTQNDRHQSNSSSSYRHRSRSSHKQRKQYKAK